MSAFGSGMVVLVGDVMIRRSFVESGRGQALGFRATLAALREGDLVIANLEMPLSRRGMPVPKYSNLRSDPDVGRDVRAMGIHAVTLANNHMLDYGPEAMFDTLDACEAAGIAHCGAGPHLEAALRPAFLRAGACNVALLSLACTLPVESAARPGKAGIAPVEIGVSFGLDVNLLVEQPGMMPLVRTQASRQDQERVCRRIAELREQRYAVIVGIHWGIPEHWMSPYQGRLAEYQQPLAYALIDAGADIVCGHHSHSLHPIEVYRGRPILYSVGNFLFEDPRKFMAPESVIVRMTLNTGLAVTLVPVILDADGFPHLAKGAGAHGVLEMLQDLSRPYGTQIAIDEDRADLLLT